MMFYNRILLKISGESLAGAAKTGYDPECLDRFAREVALLTSHGVQVGIVCGGGNLFRGVQGLSKGFDRVTGDKIGMLATTMNGLALAGAIRKQEVPVEVYSACQMEAFCPYYHPDKAKSALNKGKVVIMTGGTGNPFFTTDSASALRAIEIGANAFLKGTRVDGIYTADPEKDPTATKFSTITFQECLDRRLRIMDLTAFTLCRENNIPIVVYDLNKAGAALAICQGQKVGTLVGNL